MICTNCGEKTMDGAMFCPYCGTKLEVRKKCVKCGADIVEGASFCLMCGESVVAEASANKANAASASKMQKSVARAQKSQTTSARKYNVQNAFSVSWLTQHKDYAGAESIKWISEFKNDYAIAGYHTEYGGYEFYIVKLIMKDVFDPLSSSYKKEKGLTKLCKLYSSEIDPSVAGTISATGFPNGGKYISFSLDNLCVDSDSFYVVENEIELVIEAFTGRSRKIFKDRTGKERPDLGVFIAVADIYGNILFADQAACNYVYTDLAQIKDDKYCVLLNCESFDKHSEETGLILPYDIINLDSGKVVLQEAYAYSSSSPAGSFFIFDNDFERAMAHKNSSWENSDLIFSWKDEKVYRINDSTNCVSETNFYPEYISDSAEREKSLVHNEYLVRFFDYKGGGGYSSVDIIDSNMNKVIHYAPSDGSTLTGDEWTCESESKVFFALNACLDNDDTWQLKTIVLTLDKLSLTSRATIFNEGFVGFADFTCTNPNSNSFNINDSIVKISGKDFVQLVLEHSVLLVDEDIKVIAQVNRSNNNSGFYCIGNNIFSVNFEKNALGIEFAVVNNLGTGETVFRVEKQYFIGEKISGEAARVGGSHGTRDGFKYRFGSYSAFGEPYFLLGNRRNLNNYMIEVGGCGLVDSHGRQIVPISDDILFIADSSCKEYIPKNTFYIAYKNGKRAVIDTNGQIIAEGTYDDYNEHCSLEDYFNSANNT